jgi:hypothetical protein
MAEQKKDACAAILRSKLSPPAFERIEPLLQAGLAIYVYYYPSPPVRANYLGDLSMPQFKQFVARTLDQDRTVAGWTRLLIRLLYLGYLPYSVLNEGLGACMDFGNAALDGGFCDPDSIVALDARSDDEFFHESVIQSCRILQNTVERLLGVAGSPALYPSIESFVCWQYVRQLLQAAITSEGRPGLQLDARFLKLMSPQGSADVRACAYRKNRVAQYTYFAKRHAPLERHSGDSYG